MRDIIQNYLKGLKERNELELVCVNLMNAMGLTVLSEPGRGTKQDGVDILAVGRLPGEDVKKVFLLTVKCGDIERKNWSSGPQSLKASLDEIIASYCNSTLPKELTDLPKEICVCFGGVIRETIRREYNGYVSNNETAYAHLKIHFREWNACELAQMIEGYYLKPHAYIGHGIRWLIRAWAMVESPETAIQFFCHFLHANSEAYSGESLEKRAVALSRVAFSLAIVMAQCEQQHVDNLDAAYRCAEYTVLWAWDFLGIPHGEVAEQNQRLPSYQFALIWLLYLAIGQKYFAKVAKVSEKRYAFSLACHPGCELDVNQRLFDVLGRIASFGTSLIYYHEGLKDESSDSMEQSYRNVVKGIVALFKQIVENNPTSLMLLKDDYVVEVSMAAIFLLQTSEYQFLHDWIFGILRTLRLHLLCNRAYPSTGLTYAELHAHGQRAGDEEYMQRVLGSSALLPMIAYVSAVAGFNDCFAEIQDIRTKLIKKCDFQVWFPDKSTDVNFYMNTSLHGKAMTSLTIDDQEEFLTRVNAECHTSPLAFSCANGIFCGVLFIGCRCHRYPVPPHFLQSLYMLRKGRKRDIDETDGRRGVDRHEEVVTEESAEVSARPL